MSIKIDRDFDELVMNIDNLMKTMYFCRQDFSITTGNQHIGTCINYADLQEMRNDFLEELVHTIIEFVYSSRKQDSLIEQFSRGRTKSAAYSKLLQLSRNKFRTTSLQGQFSELLIFNLLQYYFKAIPLLRKMPITTNPELERNGADAIHLAKTDDKYLIYLAEAKTYNRTSNSSLKEALKDATHDMINVHYSKHREELNLYIYDDFISPELEEVARNYKEGNFEEEYEVHMVCIVSYDMKANIDLTNRDTAINSLIKDIEDNTKNIMASKTFRNIPPHLLPRMNFIIFPIKDLEDLIDEFTKRMRR